MLTKTERFGLLREIEITNPATYDERIFVTLDVDWAPDFVIREIDALLRSHQIRATWFITHSSEAINDLRNHQDYEIGVHPNFSPALMGAPGAKSVKSVIEHARLIAPEATSFRCHSLVQSTPLLYAMYDAGFTTDCNSFLPFTPMEALFPWRHGSGPMRVPYCWEDDTWIIGSCRSPNEVISSSGLAVVCFHPIHLWLNSEDLHRYDSVKHAFHDEDLLRFNRNHNSSIGVLAAFRKIVGCAD